MLKLFLEFVVKRHQIHLKRMNGQAKPWTTDPILQNYRFTNVFREYDRETRNLIRLVHKSDKLNWYEKLINIILFRLWNKAETFEGLGGPWSFSSFTSQESFMNALASALQRAETVGATNSWFTGAFMTSGLNQGLRKIEIYEQKAIDYPNFLRPLFGAAKAFLYIVYLIHKKPHQPAFIDSPEHVLELCEQVSGVGDFLSYQMFVDMTYLDWFPFSENEFVVSGPGCHMGLNFLFDDGFGNSIDPRNGYSDEELLYWLRDNQDRFFADMNLNPASVFWDRPKGDQRLNIMSLENCFCEFSKWVRLYRGQSAKLRPFQGGDRHGAALGLS